MQTCNLTLSSLAVCGTCLHEHRAGEVARRESAKCPKCAKVMDCALIEDYARPDPNKQRMADFIAQSVRSVGGGGDPAAESKDRGALAEDAAPKESRAARAGTKRPATNALASDSTVTKRANVGGAGAAASNGGGGPAIQATSMIPEDKIAFKLQPLQGKSQNSKYEPPRPLEKPNIRTSPNTSVPTLKEYLRRQLKLASANQVHIFIQGSGRELRGKEQTLRLAKDMEDFKVLEYCVGPPPK